MSRLLDHHVLLVTGKGGVGKSTVATAIARAAAADGKKVLLVEYESVSRAAPLFGLDHVGTRPIKVDDRLWVRGFDTIDSLHFFALQQLKIERVAKAVLRNNTVRGFFMAMPAIKSVTFLYHLWRLTEEHGPDGDGTWDLLVCDLPTTGFVKGLYGVPEMVQQIFHVGPLARIVQGMGDFLFDRRRVGLVMVTLPEEMPVVETIEFVAAMRAAHGIEPAATIVNGVVPSLLQETELGALQRVSEAAPGGGNADFTGILQAAQVHWGRQQRADRLRPELVAATGAPVHDLPHLFARKLPLQAVDELAGALLRSLTAQPAAAARS